MMRKCLAAFYFFFIFGGGSGLQRPKQDVIPDEEKSYVVSG